MENATTVSKSASLQTFGVLIGLLILEVLAVALQLPAGVAHTVIFTAAIIQAVIVIRRYMGLRSEDALIYVVALLPFALLIAYAFVILPDIGFHK